MPALLLYHLTSSLAGTEPPQGARPRPSVRARNGWAHVSTPRENCVSEPTPEKPEEPKRRDLTRAFNAIVRRPGEKKSVSGHIVTIGMAVVLAGAVAVGVGAIVFRPHAKPKPVAAADKRRSGSPSPSASPQAGGPQPPRTGPGVTGPDPVRQPPAGDPPGGHGKKK